MRESVLWHQDNASSAITKATVDKAGFGLVGHPPHSPDLAPSDVKKFAWRRCSSDNDVI